MFDEIDTGVSGEISNKIGDIMREIMGLENKSFDKIS